MNDKDIEKIVIEFFKRRFPNKNITFEKECGYFWEWVDRFKTGNPERFMDGNSLQVKKDIKKVI